MLVLEDLGHQSAAAIAQENNKLRSCFVFFCFAVRLPSHHPSHCRLLPLQPQLRCCGVYNYTSWSRSVYYPSNGIPASCCINSSDCNPEDLRNATVAPSKVYHQVCRLAVSLRLPVLSRRVLLTNLTSPPAAASDTLPDTNHDLAPDVPV